MSIKLIACDMDGTILSSQDKISDEDIKAVEYIMEKGINFVFASGRNISSMYPHLKRFKGKSGEFAISQNGACVFDLNKDEILLKATIPDETARYLLEYGIENGLMMELFTPRKVYIYNITKERAINFRQRGIDFTEVDEQGLLRLIQGEVCKINYVSHMEELQKHRGILETRLKDQINFVFSGIDYLDMTKKGIDKGNGLKFLADRLNIKQEEIITLGDNYNDYEMVRDFNGFAVANAVEDLKKVAKKVLKSDHNHNPIVEIVEHLGL